MKKNSGRKSGFKAVFSFEYMSYIKNKAFIISTAVIVILMIIGSFLPVLIIGLSNNSSEEPTEKPKIAVLNNAYESDKEIVSALQKKFEDNEIIAVTDSENDIKSNVENGEYSFAVFLDKPLSYRYVTNTNSIFDDTTTTIDEAVTFAYRTTELEKSGVSVEQSEKLLNATAKSEIITLGTDQTSAYLSTYILLMVLYMSILMYGQMVCNSVVTEKSTRAMEMLITCARPSDLMFGKVLGTGLAGFTQIAVILGVGTISFGVSATSMPSEISSFFSLPVESVLFAILFFVLAFFIYAFIMAAIASLVSRAEDLNNLLTPVMFLIIFAFMIVVIGINTGTVDSPLMIVTSYIPFTAPLSMFVRISMSDVAAWEIVISVAIQIGSIFLFGKLAAAVYRIGVLLYGKPPRFSEVFKMLRVKKAAKKAV